MKLLDVPSHAWVRDIWTDRHGEAHVVLEYGAVLRLEVEGLMSALEFVVPRKRTVDWRDLQELGSWMRVDERSYR